MQQFTNLKVWAQAHELALMVYRMPDRFPLDERFGLRAQLRRAVVSVPTNVVEGAKRATDRDFAHFINIAEASAAEVEYLCVLSIALGFIEPTSGQEVIAISQSLQRQLSSLRKRLLRH